MENNNNKDVSKSIEREKVLRTRTKEKIYDLTDKSAKWLSNLKEYLNELEEDKKTEETDENLDSQEPEYESRLKTNENDSDVNQDNNSDNNLNNNSKIKTNINNEKAESNNKENSVKKTSKLKTSISNKIGFNYNQGKISKSVTTVSKIGKKIEKTKRGLTKASSDLTKAISSDGTGTEYLKTSVKRLEQNASKKVMKNVKKPIKKGIKKITSPLTNKLKMALKEVMKKGIKMILTFIVSYAEIIIPVLFAFIIIFGSCSIFSSSSESKNSYQTYMTNIQKEYDKEVDDFLKQNPDSISVGVRGSYGMVDWRSVFSLIQGLGEDSSFDLSEQKLLQKFKDAELFEKHYIIDQKVSAGKDELKTEKTIKVMVIVNPILEEYLEWINNNFSSANEYMQSKGTQILGQKELNASQIELINMLYTSDDLYDEFDKQYQDHGIKFGSNTTIRNLNSNFYLKNSLATSGYKGQCTWYSLGRALESMNVKTPTGNAQTWTTKAIAMGLNTGNAPRVNSIVVMAGSKFGHVAYVESYDGKTIKISEGNVGNACYGKDDCNQVEYANNHANELVKDRTYNSFTEFKKSRMASGYYIVGFVYLD